MIVMGLNQGMQPIAGYNFGAGLYPRVTRVLKLTIYGATIVTTTGFLMGMLIPGFGRIYLYFPRRIDPSVGRRTSDCGAVFPDSRVPDGDVELLPKHRDGK